MLDIYFNKDYGKICEYVDGGTCELFECKTDAGVIRNMFIKRAVPGLINGVQYYDIVTPYGYGGPIICEVFEKEKLIEDYKIMFGNYCQQNNIVCEFVRYHPIFRNWEGMDEIYTNIYSRNTVGTNLKDYDDPVQKEFGKSARREAKKAAEAGIYCVLNESPKDLSVFRKLYEETMDRNHAEEMYYFPDEYYELLTSKLSPYILEIQAHYDGEIIASEIYFTQGKFLHAHLLGSNQKLLDLHGGTLLEAAAARWGKEHGYEYIHHGGGRSSASDDPLYLYKKKFGKNTEFEFYVGKKIWNEEIYNLLVQKRLEQGEIENTNYFPAYRA